jgi:hypothetical protein
MMKLRWIVMLVAICAAMCIFAAHVAHSQAILNAPPNNVYGLGPSWNNGATPAVDGNAFYCHLALTNTTSSTTTVAGTTETTYPTFACTTIDVLPIAIKPFTVSTNVSVGTAQKVLSLGGFDFMTLVTAGVTATGTSTGWNWTGGMLADYRIKKAGLPTPWGIYADVRWIKSSVSNGAGYQLIPGGGVAYHF